ncbi:MAG: YegP family protein [Gemmatimonadales bacterium]
MEHLTRRLALSRLAAAITIPWAGVRAPHPAIDDPQARPMRFEVYRASRGFRWRLKSGNGQIMGQGEAYASKAGCLAAIERIQQGAADAVIDDLT